MPITTRQANYLDPADAALLVTLLNAYACDPFGGGEPLNDHTQENLALRLAKVPSAVSLFAYADDKPAGLANCFEGFSTFACAPLLNIHDLVVLPAFRRQGVGRALLAASEEIARERGCCKLTLEVLSNNHGAQTLYQHAGFAGYELTAEAGQALFMQKPLG